MDYTTLARVKVAFGASESADDTLLGTLITAASRAIDRHCTGVARPDAENYFELDDVSAEIIMGIVDADGRIRCGPRKPVVNSVAALAYRASPLEGWTTFDVQYVTADGGIVLAWTTLTNRRPVQVKLSYNGGLAATADELPDDLVEAATVLTVRFYREVKAGLTDSIGVAELGTLVYTKAWPVRLLEMLKPYQRLLPW